MSAPHSGRSRAGTPAARGWAWVAAAAFAGAATSAIASGVLGWPRDAFVAIHATVVGALVAGYGRAAGVHPAAQLRRRWRSGLAGGILLGAALAYHVLTAPGPAAPAGPVPPGRLLWLGLVYGTADALLLTVIPVLAIYGAEAPERLRRAGARAAAGGRALLAGLLVTAAYHLGFPEFRGPAVVQPLIGNCLVTAGYLLTGNPLTPVVAHVLLHAAAVIRGPEATVQLPPHATDRTAP